MEVCDGRVSDFRELNKVINRNIYPMPRIQTILTKRSGYVFFTKLDVSMQYYTFALDVESQNFCVISTLFGLCKYLRLPPMGVKQSSDIAQETMEQILSDLDDVEIYIDYVGCFSMNFPDHIHLLDTILHRLQANGFTSNPSKCVWAVQETDWFGY